MMRLSAVLTLSGAIALLVRDRRIRGRSGKLQDREILRRRLDGHHRDDAIAGEILTALGYTPKVTVLSVPVTYTSMKNKDIDVFLGNWQPSMENDRKPYVEDKSVVVIGANLPGARNTRSRCRNTRSTRASRLRRHREVQGLAAGKIYGIEPGNDGNRLVLDMIKDGEFRPKGLPAGQSSEQACSPRSRTPRAATRTWSSSAGDPSDERQFQDRLSLGRRRRFGPNFGGAIVYTNERAGWAEECPNAAKLIKNLVFTVDIENMVMNKILTDGEEGPRRRRSGSRPIRRS